MTLEQMKEYLTKIQNQSSQTKMLNAILTCFEENKNLEKAIIEIQQKINEIIDKINGSEETGDAEALNHDIEEDIKEQDIVVEDNKDIEIEKDALEE